MSREKKAIYNSITAFMAYIINIVVGFFSRAIFVRILNVEYLGISGLFQGILSILSVTEIGISSAIMYFMYKPIKQGNEKQVSALNNFYKKAYYVIAIIIAVIGIALIPFLDNIIKSTSVLVNLKLIYVIVLFETVITFILSYKRTMIFVSQDNYSVNIIHIIYIILMNILTILGLFITKNYYAYLIIKVIVQIVESIAISVYANKKYKFLKTYRNEKINKEDSENIYKKVKGLMWHKFATFVLKGSNNIIISKYLGLAILGIYSNYLLILNTCSGLIYQTMSSLISSIGSLLVEKNTEKNFNIFCKIRFLNFYLTVFSGSFLLVVLNSFVKIWLGAEYLFNEYVIIALVISFYINITRNAYIIFKEGAGIWSEDRYVPIIETILNISISILFVKKFGIIGVFIGKIISELLLWIYTYPRFVYKNIFSRSYKKYAKETLAYLALFCIIQVIIYIISRLINITNPYYEFIINTLIALIIPNLIMISIFHKDNKFVYFKNIIFNIIKSIVKNKKQ